MRYVPPCLNFKGGQTAAYRVREYVVVLRHLKQWWQGRIASSGAEPSAVIKTGSQAASGPADEDAVASYTEALAKAPSAEIYYRRANALNRMGRIEPAIADYTRALDLDRSHSKAYCNRGTAFAAVGDLESALADYDRALQLDPDDCFAHYNRAHALKVVQRPAEALLHYDRAIALKPTYVEAHVNRGHLLQELQRHAEAEASYEIAIGLNPSVAEAFLGRGLSRFRLGSNQAALLDMDKALSLRPVYLEAMIDRSHVLQALKRPAEAAEGYSRALALKPAQRYLIGLRRHAMMQVCDWAGIDEDLASIRLGLERGVQVCPPLSVLALLDSPRHQRMAAEIWAADECPPVENLGVSDRRETRAKLRIGYFSADFREHAVALLTAAIFESHDESLVECIAFSFGPESSDATRARLVRAFDRFIDVRAYSDAQVAGLARELGIDVAVDLGGYTAHCRTGIFALRAAPIQIGYLGYMGTMGTPYFDYLIADPNLVPEVERPNYSEKIIYLPCYQSNDARRESARVFSRGELGLPESGFVFCCFNSNFKILPATFDSWMRILNRVPGATMYLYVDDASARKNLTTAAIERNVEQGRLVFGDRLPAPDYLARYRCMDLFLDTLPYNAGTTATDSLWMGVPVLTMRGHSMAGRMASSLLQAIELPELIVATAQAYEDVAVDLASQPALYASVRRRLMESVRSSALFNPRQVTLHLESAFRAVHDRYIQGEAPADIRISHGAK